MQMSTPTPMRTSPRGFSKKTYEPKKGNIIKLKSYLKENDGK
jgi:hypothetical protein